MKILRKIFASTAILFVSASAFAATGCEGYMATANKGFAKYFNTFSGTPKKNVYFTEDGDRIPDSMYGAIAVRIDSYTLPTSISKKLYYRFTGSTLKGVRNATGRHVCAFRFEMNDGYETKTGQLDFDVEPFDDPSRVVMYGSVGAPIGAGQLFDSGVYAQQVINGAMRKTIMADPQYKGKFRM